MKTSDMIAEAFQRVTPDLAAIYGAAKRESVQSVRTHQGSLAAASGAAAFAVPFLHVSAALADLVVLMNRMAVASYAIGSVKGVEAGRGNILEDHDFERVLGIWSGHLDPDSMTAEPEPKEARTHLDEAGAKLLGQVGLKTVGLSVGRRIGTQLAWRVGSKIGAQVGGKALAGFVPLLGAAVGAGVNYTLINGLCDAAERYYDWKLTPAPALTDGDGPEAGGATTTP